MSDDKMAPISCGECSRTVASMVGGAVIIKSKHGVWNDEEKRLIEHLHVTIISADRLLADPPLRPSLKRV